MADITEEKITTDTTEVDKLEKDDDVEEIVDQDNDVNEEEEDKASGNEDDLDEYSYLKREGFTTELFKIDVHGLPKYASINQFRKRMIGMNLKPKKVKVLGERKFPFAYVTFANEEDRVEAIKVLDGTKWKRSTMRAGRAAPKADPLLQKRRLDREGQTSGEPLEKLSKLDENIPTEERIRAQVLPMWDIPYEEQLKTKQSKMENVLRSLAKRLHSYRFEKALIEKKQANDGMCCPLETIKPSPKLEQYRNKSEFTIGRSADGEENVVGFRYGSYKAGCSRVGEPPLCRHIPNKVLALAKAFQTYIRTTPYESFNPVTTDGHWRLLMVRTTDLGDMMIRVEFHPQKLPEEEIQSVKEGLIKYFSEGDGKDLGVTSVYYQSNGGKLSGANNEADQELIHGNEYMYEKLLDCKFRISIDAFFQVNTPATEVLYSTVGNWCGLTPETTVIDVCCGTGTIGLTLAKKVKEVIGIEMCASAVEDARENAKLNDSTNTYYHCSKAEDVFHLVINQLKSDDVVAIVDPPRAGLHQKVIMGLRKCEKINKLIYVSCNPSSASQNFEDLCRIQSKKMKGQRFLPVKAVAVDLFPDTRHCELVILFERDSENKSSSEDDKNGKEKDELETDEKEKITEADNKEDTKTEEIKD